MDASSKIISFWIEKYTRLLLAHRRMPITPPAFVPRSATRPVSAELSWHLVRRNGRPAEVIAFEESVVAFFLESANLLGAPKSLAAVYGVCFASPEPLTYSEVKDRLEISSGSVSQTLPLVSYVQDGFNAWIVT